MNKTRREIKMGSFSIGRDHPIVLIAGPCVIESEEMAISHARKIKEITEKNNMPFIFKASYDKANRSSINSFRGPGITDGLKILQKIKEEINVPVVSDVHDVNQIDIASKVLDIIQIPAFLSRQTDLLIKAAKSGKPVNVKKGQFMSPHEMKNVVAKIEESGGENILLTDRGTSFGYNMLVSDFRALVIMAETGWPIVFDATHSVQMPGGLGTSSSGEAEYVLPLSKAAVAVGCDVLFVEVHEDPKSAKSDGANMIKLSELDSYIKEIKKIEKSVRF